MGQHNGKYRKLSLHRLTSSCQRKPRSFSEMATVHRLASDPMPRQHNGVLCAIRRLRRANTSTPRATPKRSVGGGVLSTAQKLAICESWLQVENKVLFGIQTYLGIFNQDPELRKVFLWQKMTDDELKDNARFQHQAIAVMRTVDNCVESIEQLETKVKEELKKLGAKHTKYRGFGFETKYWLLFRNCMLQSLSDGLGSERPRSKQKTLRAWGIFLTFIVETMRKGYEDKLQRQNRPCSSHEQSEASSMAEYSISESGIPVFPYTIDNVNSL